ncbi:response regulator [Rhodovulum sp. DZ06]|uniref:response regulator n=1 Tax=Rhodovulum sp. DZ06 TaxID=3425126 RepID=UPI003D33FAAA
MPMIFSQDVRGSPASLQDLLADTPLLRAAVGADGKLLGISAGLRSAAGLGAAPVEGLTVQDLLTCDSSEELQDLLIEHAFSPRIFTLDAVLRSQDGMPMPVLVNASPLGGPDGAPQGRFLTIIELSDSRLFRQAVQARRDAQHADALKTRLLAQVSHEVRTPLNIVMGYIQLARAGRVGEDEARHLDTALAAIAALTTQLGAVLDRAQASAQAPALNIAPFDPAAAVQGLCARMARTGGPGGGPAPEPVRCNVDPALPRSLEGDVTRIEEALGALAEAALAAPGAGPVSLHARALGCEGAAWRLRLSVCAGGAFDPAAADLAGCCAIAARMGAEVGVERCGPDGEGCVHLELVLPEGEPRAAAAPLAAASGPSRRVLVAEDDQRNRRLLGEALARMGHEVRFAVDGREAVKACAAHRFDVVLMDMRMPHMRGDEAARRIRTEGRNRETPIIAVTANPVDDEGGRVEDAGFDDVLMKPLDLGAVRALIDALPAR